MSHARPSVLWFPFTLSILFVLFRSRNIIKKFEWSKKMKLVEQVQIFFVSCFSRLQVFLISLGLVTVYKAMPYTVVGRQQPRIVFFFSHRFKTCVCAGREREIPVPIWCSLRAEMRGACGIHPYICVYWTCVCLTGLWERRGDDGRQRQTARKTRTRLKQWRDGWSRHGEWITNVCLLLCLSVFSFRVVK